MNRRIHPQQQNTLPSNSNRAKPQSSSSTKSAQFPSNVLNSPKSTSAVASETTSRDEVDAINRRKSPIHRSQPSEKQEESHDISGIYLKVPNQAELATHSPLPASLYSNVVIGVDEHEPMPSSSSSSGEDPGSSLSSRRALEDLKLIESKPDLKQAHGDYLESCLQVKVIQDSMKGVREKKRKAEYILTKFLETHSSSRLFLSESHDLELQLKNGSQVALKEGHIRLAIEHYLVATASSLQHKYGKAARAWAMDMTDYILTSRKRSNPKKYLVRRKVK